MLQQAAQFTSNSRAVCRLASQVGLGLIVGDARVEWRCVVTNLNMMMLRINLVELAVVVLTVEMQIDVIVTCPR